MRHGSFFLTFVLAAGAALGQDAPGAPPAEKPAPFVVQPGTHIPLSMINSVNTRNSHSGDRIYLQTVFPILAGGRIVIPPGSYVEGTVTEVKRPGRVKGRGMLFCRFDSLTLPNGVTRDFRARVGAVDGRSDETLEKSEGKVVSEGGKSTDAKTIGVTTASGGLIGAGLGGEVGHMGEGAGIGAGAGAAAGLMMALLSRGPEASLPKGSTIEMVLDRPLSFTSEELVSPNSPTPANFTEGGNPAPSQKSDGIHGMRHLPI